MSVVTLGHTEARRALLTSLGELMAAIANGAAVSRYSIHKDMDGVKTVNVEMARKVMAKSANLRVKTLRKNRKR